MKKRAMAILVLCFVTGFFYGEFPEGFENLLDAAVLEKLEKSGELSTTFNDKVNLSYFPDIKLRAQIIKEIKQLNPIFGVEVLLTYKMTGKDFSREKDLLELYNILRSVQSLKGIEYYSGSRGRMRIMFHDAYIVDSPQTKNKIPDRLVSIIPAYSTLFIYQNDSSFGENIFETVYYSENGYFLMKMENLTKIWYGLVPLIDPHNLNYIIFIYPKEDTILFYSVVCVNAFNLFGIAESRTASFYYRIKALFNWFCSRLN
ncbi:MAG: hypothetical protein JW822_06385 [Spirochaetales bacterium]|nr:hypothetical protein [Spirochaetales bacterium]